MADSTNDTLRQQFEQIRDERGLYANTATRIGNAFLSLLSYVGSMNLPYLRKDIDDTAEGVITFLQGLLSEGDARYLKNVYYGENFVEGIVNGIGGRITADARGELNSLVLRESLTVPSITFNSVEVVKGESWQAAGCGEIESVTVESETTGIATLRLEEGEYGAIAVGDICKAFFHFDEDLSKNATADSDDSKGNTTFAGFCTIFFWVTEILETGDNSRFRYQLRPEDKGGNLVHPQPHSKFIAQGSFMDTARQNSVYRTRTYTRYLTGVNNWTFDINNIAMQLGDLSNLSIFNLDMSGYSAYLNNIYMSGTIHQVNVEGVSRRIIIEQSLGGFLAPDEQEVVTLRVENAVGEDFTADYWFKVERDTGDAAADAVWNDETEHAYILGVEGGSELPISYDDLHIGPTHTGVSTLFYVTATENDGTTVTVAIEY